MAHLQFLKLGFDLLQIDLHLLAHRNLVCRTNLRQPLICLHYPSIAGSYS